MSDTELLDLLKQLHQETENISIEEAEKKQRLLELIDEMEQRAVNPDDFDQYAGLLNNIKQTVTQLELDHPRASGILNDIMRTLGNMGI